MWVAIARSDHHHQRRHADFVHVGAKLLNSFLVLLTQRARALRMGMPLANVSDQITRLLHDRAHLVGDIIDPHFESIRPMLAITGRI